MILEAFATYLQSADPQLPASAVLARWLWERLSVPAENNVDRVLHCEISMGRAGRGDRNSFSLDAGPCGPSYVFSGTSDSGRRLLRSLYQYSLSYEQQKWARWVHGIKASDFNGPHPR